MSEPTPTTIFSAPDDVTGIVDATAAAEIAAIMAKLKALIPDPDTAPANRDDTAVGMSADQISPMLALQLRAEIAAVAAAIAAAPAA